MYYIWGLYSDSIPLSRWIVRNNKGRYYIGYRVCIGLPFPDAGA